MRRFKLYLAGIETLFPYAEYEHHHSSNCTLLELKPFLAKYMRIDTLFKLYLAGIETCHRFGCSGSWYGSNCTLLELKRR